MTREDKLYSMTGATLIKVADKLGVKVNCNKTRTSLKEAKSKVIERILAAENATAENATAETEEPKIEEPKIEEATLEVTEEKEEPEIEEVTEEEKEDQPQETTKNNWETIAKENIKNAYDWIVGGYENSVLDGEKTEEEQEEWIKNEALDEIYHEAISTKYTPEMTGGNAPKEMKRASKKFCMEYIIELFKNDGYELEMPEIKKGHPAPKRGALIEFDGKSQNICAWGKELGISANTLYGRIYKMGWSVERAFTTLPRKK